MRKRSILLAVPLFVICVVLAAVFAQKPKEHQLSFLTSYGAIWQEENARCVINLPFVTCGDVGDLAAIPTVSVNTEGVHISHVELVPSLKAGLYQLWFVKFDLSLTDREKPVHFEQITLNGMDYSLGQLSVYPVESGADHSALKLTSCAGASLGRGLKDYYANFKNCGTSAIKISSVNTPCFEGTVCLASINGSEQFLELPVAIEPGETVKVLAAFHESDKNRADAYYVAPSVEYIYEGKHFEKVLDYYTSGLNISESDLREIGDTIFEQ